MMHKHTITIELSEDDCITLYKILGNITTADFYEKHGLTERQYIETIEPLFPILTDFPDRGEE